MSASRMRMSPPSVIPTMAPAGKWRVLLVAESAAVLGEVLVLGGITETLGLLRVGCASVCVDVGGLGVKLVVVVCCWVVVVGGGGLKLVVEDGVEPMTVVKVNGAVREKP
jgi:hypothetical protein